MSQASDAGALGLLLTTDQKPVWYILPTQDSPFLDFDEIPNERYPSIIATDLRSFVPSF